MENSLKSPINDEDVEVDTEALETFQNAANGEFERLIEKLKKAEADKKKDR